MRALIARRVIRPWSRSRVALPETRVRAHRRPVFPLMTISSSEPSPRRARPAAVLRGKPGRGFGRRGNRKSLAGRTTGVRDFSRDALRAGSVDEKTVWNACAFISTRG